MANEKYVRLISKLLQATEEGTLQWESTARNGVYQAAFPTYGVRVYAEGQDIVLAIVNSEGATIDEVPDTLFDRNDFGARSPMRVMSDLLRAAKRRALGADEAVDEILKDLD